MWRNIKVMKPVADRINEDIQIAKDKFRPCADYENRLAKAKEFEQNLLQSKDMEGFSEYREFMDMYDKYNELIEKAMDDYSKEIPIDVYKLSEASFKTLVTSNKLDDSQRDFLKEVLVSEN